MTKYYALKHIETGRLMPATIGRLARGWSFWEPKQSHAMKLPQEVPRLFATRRAAINAASGWAQGVHVARTEYESDGWEYPSYPVTVVHVEQPPKPRLYTDLHIVEVTLSIKE